MAAAPFASNYATKLTIVTPFKVSNYTAEAALVYSKIGGWAWMSYIFGNYWYCLVSGFALALMQTWQIEMRGFEDQTQRFEL